MSILIINIYILLIHYTLVPFLSLLVICFGVHRYFGDKGGLVYAAVTVYK